jgi:hypothetical protein
MVDDLEAVRIATENRLRSLTAEEWYGKGMRDTKTAEDLEAMAKDLAVFEHEAVKSLKRAVRTHPLYGWIQRTVGIGEKQGARLLAAIGDPWWNDLHERPRTVSELWAYCGYHVIGSDSRGQGTSESQPGTATGIAPKRTKGQKANWNQTARARAWLVANSCIKQTHSPYRATYEAGREKYAEAVHQHVCERCGPKGRPAQPGSPLNEGHKHARAVRLVAKEILKDLWLEAKAWHENQLVETVAA